MNSTIAISTTHIASDGKTYVVTSEADAGSGDQSAVTAGVLATLDKVLIQMKKDRP